MDIVVVADASPLIGLATADLLAVLRDLFGTVTITKIVKDEVMAGEGMPGARELDGAMRAGWIRVARAPAETWKHADLGPGEASTIALASEHRDTALVLMDDALGRERARALGLEVKDLPSLLVSAKRARLVAAIAPLLERLARRGFTVPPESASAALAAAGELGASPRD